MSRGRAGWLWPPLLTFILARLYFAWAAWAVRYDPWNAASWRRWDSGHYLFIASRGYELFSCARLGGPATDVCGNAAWFPLYPSLLRPWIRLGVSPELVGATVSGVLALAFLIALWALLLARAGRTGWLLLAMAAVFPGAVYQHAIFPTSLVLLAMVLAGAAMARGHWLAAGGAGALAAMSYVTGVLLAPVQVVAAWIRTRAIRPAVLAGGPPLLGLGAVLALHQLLLGRWNAFYWVYRKGVVGVAHPVEAFLSVVLPAFDPAGDPPRRTIAAQTLTVAALVVLGLVTAWRHRQRPDPVRAWAVTATLAFWSFPLVVGRGVSLYRAEVLVLPVLLLLVDLPPWALALLLAWLAVLGQAMARLFFSGWLV